MSDYPSPRPLPDGYTIPGVTDLQRANSTLAAIGRYTNEASQLLSTNVTDRAKLQTSYNTNKANADKFFAEKHLYPLYVVKDYTDAWNKYNAGALENLRTYGTNKRLIEDAVKGYVVQIDKINKWKAEYNDWLKKTETYEKGFVPFVQSKTPEQFREEGLRTVTGVSGIPRFPTIEETRELGTVSVSGEQVLPADLKEMLPAPSVSTISIAELKLKRELSAEEFRHLQERKLQEHVLARTEEGVIRHGAIVTDKFKVERLERYESDGLIKKVLIPGATGPVLGYSTTRAFTEYSDTDLKKLEGAGFTVPEMTTGAVWDFYRWGERTFKGDSPGQRLTEYTSAMVGTGVASLEAPYRFLTKLFTGKTLPTNRRVTSRTLKYFETLSPQQQAYLSVGGFGASFLGSYVGMLPLGVATSGVLQAARGIAGGIGVATPQLVNKIAYEISKHPNIVKAVLIGPIVGVNAVDIYDRFQSGDSSEDILGEISVRAGSMLGGMRGLQEGFRLPTKIRGWIETRGRTRIPPEDLWRPTTLETGKLPNYEGAQKQTYSSQFTELAGKLSAEDYIGKVAPGEYRVWHGTGDPWKLRVMQTTEVMAGSSLDKFPGLFVAPEPSPLRLPTGGVSGRLGLPGIGGAYELITADALIEVMPSGLSKADTWAWLASKAGTNTAYIPPVSMITTEMEALIPVGTTMIKVGDSWYTNWAGVRIQVNQYVMATTQAQIDMAVAAGYEVTNAGSLYSSAPSLTDTYLTFGISPTSSTGSSYIPSGISSSDLETLAQEYGMTVDEITGITDSVSETIGTASSYSPFAEPVPLTAPLPPMSDLLDVGAPPDIPPVVPIPTLPDVPLDGIDRPPELDVDPSGIVPQDVSPYADPSIPSVPDIKEPLPVRLPETTDEYSEYLRSGSPDMGELSRAEKVKLRKLKYKYEKERRIKPSKKPEPYKVQFQYATGASETKDVKAFSFVEAYGKGNRARVIKLVPIEVFVEAVIFSG